MNLPKVRQRPNLIPQKAPFLPPKKRCRPFREKGAPFFKKGCALFEKGCRPKIRPAKGSWRRLKDLENNSVPLRLKREHKVWKSNLRGR